MQFLRKNRMRNLKNPVFLVGIISSLLSINSYGYSIPKSLILNSDDMNKGKPNVTLGASNLPIIYDPRPGVGYVSDNGMAAQTACFKFSNVSKSGQYAEYEITAGSTLDQLTSKLDITTSGELTYEDVTATDTFEYLEEHTDTDLTQNIFFYYKLGYDEQVSYAFSSNMLNADGIDSYNNGNDPLFRLHCGDRLITGWKQGAFVIADIELTFKSSNDKTAFDNKFNISSEALGNITNDVKNSINQLHEEIHYSVSAFQVGGDVSKLGAITNADVKSCDNDNLDACGTTLSAISNYFTSIFPEEFTESSDKYWDGALVPVSDYHISDDISPYFKLAPSFATPDTLDLRNKLLKLYTKAEAYTNGASTIINSSAYNSLSDEWQGYFSNLYTQASANLNELNGPSESGDYISSCFNNPSSCQNYYDEKLPLLHKLSYDENTPILTLDPELDFDVLPPSIPIDSSYCPSGTTFDGTGCLDVTNINQYLPNLGNSCPYGASTFDGANCIVLNDLSQRSITGLFVGNNILGFHTNVPYYLLNYTYSCPSNWRKQMNFVGLADCVSNIYVDNDAGGASSGLPYHYFQLNDTLYVAINNTGGFTPIYDDSSTDYYFAYNIPYNQSFNCTNIPGFSDMKQGVCKYTKYNLGENNLYSAFIYRNNLYISPRYVY